MPTPIQSASPTVFMPALATGLRTGLSLSTDQVKIVDYPTIKGSFTETLLQKGIALSLGDMRPKLSPVMGGGRYDYRVLRTLFVRITTISHLDPSGRNEVALAAHWTFENAIADLLVLTTWSGIVIPLRVQQLTGAEWEFRTDSGRYTSFLGFEIEYPLGLTNTCG